MDLEMVFNELSLRNPAPDIPTARQTMSDFISTLRTAQSYGLKGLRTQRDFHAIILADGYPLPRWRNDNEVSREEQTFFRTLATKSPFSIDIVDSNIKNNLEDEDCEFSFQGTRVEGLKTAYWLERLAISLKSESLWDTNRLELEVTQLDDNGNLIEETVEVRHANQKSHVLEHADWIKARTRQEVRDGIDLWQQRENLFPHLIFCDSVEKQLEKLLADDPMLRSVERRLFELEKSSNSWTGGYFALDSLPCKATPESAPRLERLEQELTIRCPDGKKRLFNLHVRMTPGAWRLYFSTELGHREKIIIGYIGSKIP